MNKFLLLLENYNFNTCDSKDTITKSNKTFNITNNSNIITITSITKTTITTIINNNINILNFNLIGNKICNNIDLSKYENEWLLEYYKTINDFKLLENEKTISIDDVYKMIKITFKNKKLDISESLLVYYFILELINQNKFLKKNVYYPLIEKFCLIKIISFQNTIKYLNNFNQEEYDDEDDENNNDKDDDEDDENNNDKDDANNNI